MYMCFIYRCMCCILYWSFGTFFYVVLLERLQQERQEALENMGISVQASGIKVEKNKYYLVNLNADPSLNELLVYYLKERTLVGARAVSYTHLDVYKRQTNNSLQTLYAKCVNKTQSACCLFIYSHEAPSIR